MFEIKIEGLNDLSRQLGEAEEALKRLHGELGEVKFNPFDPADVQRAITETNKLVDHHARNTKTYSRRRGMNWRKQAG
ncbi:MAG: hypothetical protein HY315_02510 [Acidobacteria bacterium]|nr:hypothetical protein [Acidobacteriota bacterium]